VIKGEVLMSIVDAPAVSGHIRGGQVRALAVTSPSRSPDFPSLPTLRESGVAEADVGLWSGIFAPAGTPAPILRKLEAETRRVLRMPEIHDRLLGLSVAPSASSAEDFARAIRFNIERWTTVAKAANIKIEP
jgi:tripartite-type tricarboxylate transporter receptor subunit TctC